MNKITKRFFTPFSEAPFSQMRNDIEDIFNNFYYNPVDFKGHKNFHHQPKMDIIEHKDSLEVHAELPGIDKKDVKITITDNMLKIKGEKLEEKSHTDNTSNKYISERYYGKFERYINLPFRAEMSNVSAELNNGVLKIKVQKPQKEIEAEKEIQIR